jgi:Family of unknown function (DUF6516)
LYIEDYLQQVRDAISACTVVAQFGFEAEKRDTYEGLIRAEISFMDGSILQVREFVTVETSIERDMYAYQYMTAEKGLIFRYDNTPHHQKLNLPTFPDHKHDGREENVIASNAPMLWDVLTEIQAQI